MSVSDMARILGGTGGEGYDISGEEDCPKTE